MPIKRMRDGKKGRRMSDLIKREDAISGWISLGSYRPCDVTEKDSGWSTLTRIKIPTDGIIAWMPLPEPWKGADDDR